jgi:hypothetical protein
MHHGPESVPFSGQFLNCNLKEEGKKILNMNISEQNEHVMRDADSTCNYDIDGIGK